MEKTDHDLLIEVNERTKSMKIILCNHLAHHFKANIVLTGAMLSLIATLVVLLLVG